MNRNLKRLFLAATHATTLAILPVLTYRLWRNLRFLREARQLADQVVPSADRVSVLIPARNEAKTLGDCVESILAQDYPDFTVIVLDDHSTDETPKLLDNLAEGSSHLTARHATDNPPKGWNGKSYACWQLAAQATGDWLLFTDADTVHMPESVARGIALARALDVDLLSVMPYQETVQWSERLVVSFIIDFLPLIGLDLRAIWRGTAQRAVANGQYLLVQAARYREVGGHQAIATALVDDIALAKRFKEAGYKIAFVNGADLVRCRMYYGAGEVWNGFLKNILLGLQSSAQQATKAWQALPFAWGYGCLFVMPYVHLACTKQKRLALLEIGWLDALRGWSGSALQRPRLEAVTTPLGALSVMALGLAALYRKWRGQPMMWKGRAYPSDATHVTSDG